MEKYVPQIIILCVLIYGVVEAYQSNGERIIISFRGEIICFTITLALLLWGGFFNGIFSLLGIGG